LDVKRDGSCGYEFASCKLQGDQGLFDSKLAVEKIREVAPNAVNQKCGIHVTVDVSDHSSEDLKRLIIGYLKAQEHFYSQCSEWRQSNHYCQRNPVDKVSTMVTMSTSNIGSIVSAAGGTDRYHGLNLTNTLGKHIVEFRMLESTEAIRKVGAWIRMCVGFVDGLKKSGVKFTSGDEFSAATFKSVCEGTWTV
jgi:hypothetical protein